MPTKTSSTRKRRVRPTARRKGKSPSPTKSGGGRGSRSRPQAPVSSRGRNDRRSHAAENARTAPDATPSPQYSRGRSGSRDLRAGDRRPSDDRRGNDGRQPRQRDEREGASTFRNSRNHGFSDDLISNEPAPRARPRQPSAPADRGRPSDLDRHFRPRHTKEQRELADRDRQYRNDDRRFAADRDYSRLDAEDRRRSARDEPRARYDDFADRRSDEPRRRGDDDGAYRDASSRRRDEEWGTSGRNEEFEPYRDRREENYRDHDGRRDDPRDYGAAGQRGYGSEYDRSGPDDSRRRYGEDRRDRGLPAPSLHERDDYRNELEDYEAGSWQPERDTVRSRESTDRYYAGRGQRSDAQPPRHEPRSTSRPGQRHRRR